MDELLKQALWLTVVGMGMTFTAIGALVLGMYALTALFPGKKKQPPAEVTAPVGAAPEPVSADRYRAAVAAVAVAVAQTRLRPAAAAAPVSRFAGDEWTPYVRSHHLAQRDLYSSRPRR